MNDWEKCIYLLQVVNSLLDEMIDTNDDKLGFLDKTQLEVQRAIANLEDDTK